MASALYLKTSRPPVFKGTSLPQGLPHKTPAWGPRGTAAGPRPSCGPRPHSAPLRCHLRRTPPASQTCTTERSTPPAPSSAASPQVPLAELLRRSAGVRPWPSARQVLERRRRRGAAGESAPARAAVHAEPVAPASAGFPPPTAMRTVSEPARGRPRRGQVSCPGCAPLRPELWGGLWPHRAQNLVGR